MMSLPGLGFVLLGLALVGSFLPVVCGMAVHAAWRRRFLAAAIIAASAAAAVSATFEAVTGRLPFDEAAPRVVVGVLMGIAVWGLDVVRGATAPATLVARAVMAWAVCAVIGLATVVRWVL